MVAIKRGMLEFESDVITIADIANMVKAGLLTGVPDIAEIDYVSCNWMGSDGYRFAINWHMPG